MRSYWFHQIDFCNKINKFFFFHLICFQHFDCNWCWSPLHIQFFLSFSLIIIIFEIEKKNKKDYFCFVNNSIGSTSNFIFPFNFIWRNIPFIFFFNFVFQNKISYCFGYENKNIVMIPWGLIDCIKLISAIKSMRSFSFIWFAFNTLIATGVDLHCFLLVTN